MQEECSKIIAVETELFFFFLNAVKVRDEAFNGIYVGV